MHATQLRQGGDIGLAIESGQIYPSAPALDSRVNERRIDASATQCPEDEARVAHFGEGDGNARQLTAFDQGVAAGIENFSAWGGGRGSDEVLPLAAIDPRRSFNDLNFRRASY